MEETELFTTNSPDVLPGTIYVHLNSSEVIEIENAEEITVTEEHLIFTRGDLEAVILDRRDVYYTCCQAGDTPSAY